MTSPTRAEIRRMIQEELEAMSASDHLAGAEVDASEPRDVSRDLLSLPYRGNLGDRLGSRARLAFAFMCWQAQVSRARDRRQVAEYSGGHLALLEHVVGRERASQMSPSSGRSMVSRAIKELLDAGLIVRMAPPQPGQNACYRIVTDAHS